MATLEDLIAERVRDAVSAPFGIVDIDPEIRPATKPEFGHFQTSVPLRLARTASRPSRVIAEQLADAVDVADLCEPPTVAGPGFINFSIRPEYLAAHLREMLADPSLGIARAEQPQRVVIDFSSPNIAKEMHVGHLRSTVIGDSLARILEHVGHDVIRQNHVGDWGTQFGMLIEQLLDPPRDRGQPMTLAGLTKAYRAARARFDNGDTDFQESARRRVVALQSGDPETAAVWRDLITASITAFQATYDRLGVKLTVADIAGESTYNDRLRGIVDNLADASLLTESEGADCAFLPGVVDRYGSPVPLIIRKSDGGYGYAATDLAAIRHRVGDLAATWIIYVVDARQSLHFEQVFALARAAGWLPDGVQARHVAFGSVLGEDGRPLKTSSGDPFPLSALLDAAEARAGELLARSGTTPPDQRASLARAIGVAAVKYADLSNDLGKDYLFDLDRMVAPVGRTGPYLQYAHARTRSILRRAGSSGEPVVRRLDEPAEQRLALQLCGLGLAVSQAAAALEPHHVCRYLFDLATAYSSFYEACSILRSSGEVRESRLALCAATAQVLALGLGLLGIQAPERL